ncbi:MAG: thiamine-phosphate kinase [Acetobacter cibinongensis]
MSGLLRTPPQTDLPAEFVFIKQHFAKLAGPAALDLSDDAAVYTPPPGKDLVIAADAMVENVHFLPTDPPETVGRKLLRCNLSDLAAMGAKPEGWLLTLACPKTLPDTWFAQFCNGLEQDQKIFSLSLMGGDTTSTTGPLVLSLTILGSVIPGQAIKRRGAKKGDGLWVTGTIGDGALGLQALLGKITDPSGHLADRYRLPQPRVGLPLSGIASAAMDISDGLIQDAGHLARENGLGVALHASQIPLSSAARACGDKWFETCLTGGDDYEILFSVPPEHEATLLQNPVMATVAGPVPVTRIGHFCKQQLGVTVLGRDGTEMTFAHHGWSHL